MFEKQPRPSFETVGELTEDGYEFLEYPDGLDSIGGKILMNKCGKSGNNDPSINVYCE